jgi:CBS domain-containing protein
MTGKVVTAGQDMSYKQAARLMTEHELDAVPVVDGSGRLLGMVSEADALRKQERKFRPGTGLLPWRGGRERAKAEARTVAGLMTSPAITIRPDALLGEAARLMNARRVRRLPVVGASGQLIGIVSRRDLLRVFLRPDEEIAGEVREILATVLPGDAGQVTAAVRDGVVTLSGSVTARALVPAAVRLVSRAPGVVAVDDQLSEARGAGTP